MSIQEESQRLKSIMMFLGLNPETRKCNYRIFISLFAAIAVLTNQLCYVTYEWDNIDHRVNSIKSLTQILVCFFDWLVFIFDFNNVTLAFNVMRTEHCEFPYPVSVKHKELIQSSQKNMLRVTRIWDRGLIMCPVLGIVLPIVYIAVALLILKHNLQDIDVNEMPMLYPIYYPEGYNTFPMYCLAYLIQNLFLVTASRYGYICSAIPFVSLQIIEGDLNLLRLSIEEMDETITPRSGTKDRKPIQEFSSSINKDVSKSFLKYVVGQHQTIYRKASHTQKGIQKFAFILTGSISIYTCAALFYVVKKKMNTLSLIQETFFCSLMAFQMFCYDYYGEKIQAADENLRKSLYECSWIDKPQWFKQYLKISMTRATRRLEIKPGGIFKLNFEHFATWMNAAYSYYNILKNFD